jgi:hypothetical protein
MTAVAEMEMRPNSLTRWRLVDSRGVARVARFFVWGRKRRNVTPCKKGRRAKLPAASAVRGATAGRAARRGSYSSPRHPVGTFDPRRHAGRILLPTRDDRPLAAALVGDGLRRGGRGTRRGTACAVEQWPC